MPVRSAAAIAMHACARYAVQLLVLSAVALAPLVYLALEVPTPRNLDQMNGVLRTPWLLAGLAPLFQLVAVGAAAPLVHAIARGAPVSQRSALWTAIIGLARGVFPASLAAAAVVTGLVAFIAPGLVLLGLFSLSAAVAATSPGSALPAQLQGSATLVRGAPIQVALVVVAMLAFDLATVVIAKSVLVTGAIGKAPTAAQLAGAGQVARASIFAIAVVTPLVGCVLAGIHVSRTRDASRALETVHRTS